MKLRSKYSVVRPAVQCDHITQNLGDESSLAIFEKRNQRGASSVFFDGSSSLGMLLERGGSQ